ncbi:MAG: 6-phosphogluconolactonase [Acidobacteriota bacterium]
MERGQARGPQVYVERSYEELCESATGHVARAAAAAITARARFVVALSGGSTPLGVYRRLASLPYAGSIAWERWHLFWGDERWVAPDNAGSNYGMARREMIDRMPLQREQVHPMPTDVGDPHEAARRYGETLRGCLAVSAEDPPRFDLILLGIGADGHTASLFPGSAVLRERRRWVAAVEITDDEAGRCSWRLTLTLPVLNAAREVLFLAAGRNKAAAVAAALESSASSRARARERTAESLPAAMVQPREGKLTWYLDQEAAAGLGASPPPS